MRPMWGVFFAEKNVQNFHDSCGVLVSEVLSEVFLVMEAVF